MKCKVIIDENCEEAVIVYARERTPLVDEIERITEGNNTGLIGYKENEITKLNPSEICCFTVENNKVFAQISGEKYAVKKRLYQLEEELGQEFIRINKSCLANLKLIKRFEASLYGGLRIVFQNGYTDYVSRRCYKKVKERFGL